MNKAAAKITSVPGIKMTGRMIRNPELKTLEDGRKLMQFPFRIEKSIYRNGMRIVMNRWHSVVVQPDRFLAMEMMNRKSIELTVVGWIRKRNYVDKSGVMRYVTEVEASEVMVVQRE